MPNERTITVDMEFPELQADPATITDDMVPTSSISSCNTDDLSELSYHESAEHILEVLPGAFDRCDSVPSFVSDESLCPVPRDKCEKCSAVGSNAPQIKPQKHDPPDRESGILVSESGSIPHPPEDSVRTDSSDTTKRKRSAFQVQKRLLRTADFLRQRAYATKTVALESIEMA